MMDDMLPDYGIVIKSERMTRDGSRTERDRGMLWIVTGYGWMTLVDDRRWMTGDGLREMDHGRRMTINLLLS
jgi:hypothetical protein